MYFIDQANITMKITPLWIVYGLLPWRSLLETYTGSLPISSCIIMWFVVLTVRYIYSTLILCDILPSVRSVGHLMELPEDLTFYWGLRENQCFSLFVCDLSRYCWVGESREEHLWLGGHRFSLRCATWQQMQAIWFLWWYNALYFTVAGNRKRWMT